MGDRNRERRRGLDFVSTHPLLSSSTVYIFPSSAFSSDYHRQGFDPSYSLVQAAIAHIGSVKHFSTVDHFSLFCLFTSLRWELYLGITYLWTEVIVSVVVASGGYGLYVGAGSRELRIS